MAETPVSGHVEVDLDSAAPPDPRANLGVMSLAFIIFGLSLAFQSHRWASTPAYHVLLQIFSAQIWGGIFLTSGALMGLTYFQYRHRWLLIASLTLAFALTIGWMLAFVVRYATSATTTPETWVSWAVFGYMLLRVALSIDFVSRPPVVPPAGVPASDEPAPAAIAEAREATRSPQAE